MIARLSLLVFEHQALLVVIELFVVPDVLAATIRSLHMKARTPDRFEYCKND